MGESALVLKCYQMKKKQIWNEEKKSRYLILVKTTHGVKGKCSNLKCKTYDNSLGVSHMNSAKMKNKCQLSLQKLYY